MDRAKEPDENRPSLRRRTTFLQFFASSDYLLHQYAGSRSSCHTHLLCQYHHVCLSVQHLHGAGWCHLHRASHRRKKPHAAFLMGKYVMKKSVMITVILSTILAIFGNTIFHWLTTNEEIIRLGTTILIIDVILEIGRPINIFATNALRAAGDVTYPSMSVWLFSGALPSAWVTSSVSLWSGESAVCGSPSCWTRTSVEPSS